MSDRIEKRSSIKRRGVTPDSTRVVHESKYQQRCAYLVRYNVVRRDANNRLVGGVSGGVESQRRLAGNELLKSKGVGLSGFRAPRGYSVVSREAAHRHLPLLRLEAPLHGPAGIRVKAERQFV